MQAMWNKINLERPPNSTWRTDACKFDAWKFRGVLDKIITELDSQDLLDCEAATLSRLIYRMKWKFRNDKGLKGMEKVNRTLLNYLSLAISKEYKNLRSYVEVDGKFLILPSKQMVEYVLVRTQGFAKLMARLEEVAKHTAHFFKTRMSIGHAWGVAVIAYAVVSRIWILSRHLAKKSCLWYDTLYRYLKNFEPVGLCWLGKDQQLPHELKTWLGVPWIDEELTEFPSAQDWKDNVFKLLQSQKTDLNEGVIFTADDTSIVEDTLSNSLLGKNISEDPECNNVEKDTAKNVNDIGEYISRNRYKRDHPTSIQQEKKPNTMDCNDKKCIEIDEEEESRPPVPKKKKNIERKTTVKSNDNKNKVNGLSNNKESKKNKSTAKKASNGTNDKIKMTLSSCGAKTRDELLKFLTRDSYEGLDKLQWNIIKKNGMKFMRKIDKCTDQKRQTLLVRKAVKSIESWIH